MIQHNSFKKPANVLLVILSVTIAVQLLAFYQTRYQLLSPLVPDSVTLKIVEPYIFNAIISSVALGVALVFRFYAKYLVAVIICSIAILFQQFHLQFQF